MSYLENTIQASYPTLTKKEGRIADYLLNHTDEAKSKTISEIAEICEVAESTVFLFSKKIGLSGFKELTVLLSNSSKKNVFEGIYEEDGIQAITKKVVDSAISSITKSATLIDFEQLPEAVSLLTSSKRTVLFSLGGSSPVALDAFHKFLRSPLEVDYINDYHMQLLMAGRMSKSDCAIIISHSGENSDILRITNLLKENEVPIIVISSFTNTTLAKAADHLFIAPSEELKYKNSGIYTRRFSQSLIIDILFTLVITTSNEDPTPSLEKIHNAINLTK